MRAIPILIIYILIPALSQAQTRTTVANGNASNLLTWDCVCIPLPGQDLIIAHDIVLDVNWGYVSGSLTINAGASLIEDIPRGMAIGGGTLLNNGIFQLSNLWLFGTAVATNNGTFQNSQGALIQAQFTNTGIYTSVDSFASSGTITNTVSGTMTIDSFWNNGTFTNNGTLNTAPFLNTDTFINSGTINCDSLWSTGTFTNSGSIDILMDLWNIGSFTNNSGGWVDVGADYLNSNFGSAYFINNGDIRIGKDWLNIDTVNGSASGQFCIDSATSNLGAMIGSFDFCDKSGGAIDLNLGTIAGTITYCAKTCATSIDDKLDKDHITVFPNPASSELILDIALDNAKEVNILLFNNIGQLVYKAQESIKGHQTLIYDISDYPIGIYFLKVFTEEQVYIKPVVIQ